MRTPSTQIIEAAQGIPAEIQRAWLRLQGQNFALYSPFFSPLFTQSVAAARDDVEVAFVSVAGEIVAIFPFERRRWKLAAPVGTFISDYHGLISHPDFAIDPRDLLRKCGLLAWDFSHIPTVQTAFVPFHRNQNRSPVINLAYGYEAYVKERRDAGSEQISQFARKMRKLEREIGPLRFVVHSPDKAILDQLIVWKTEQFRRNRWRDIFSIPWVRQTIEKIHSAQTPEFAGMLSVLYAGEKVVAAHFGMRSATVWHYWFPAYDPAFLKYSPGVILLLKMAETAPPLGVNAIDLGCGEHSYKERLMNGFVPTAGGSVELTCSATIVRRVWTSVGKVCSKAHHLVGTPWAGLGSRIRDGAS